METDRDFEGAVEALWSLKQEDPRAMMGAPRAGLWSIHPEGSAHTTATGAYTKGLVLERIGEWPVPEPIHLLARIDGAPRGWQWEEREDGRGRLVEVDDPECLIQPPAPGTPHARLAPVLDALQSAGFVPDALPFSLGDLADAVVNDQLEGAILERTVLGAPRGRSAFPFHEFEAFSSGGALAQRDAAEAVARLRDVLETCSVVAAERWGRIALVEITRELAIIAEPSPIGGWTFSPDAHAIGDWLDLTVRELAEGRGQLVVLARRFATSPEVREGEDGSLESVHPVTENPWVLFVADRGVLTQWHLKLSAAMPGEDERGLSVP